VTGSSAASIRSPAGPSPTAGRTASTCSAARPVFLAPKILRVGDDEFRADRFVLAAGSRPHAPPVPGLAELPYRTSDNIMRVDTLPKSMAVLGGGYIAAEMSHVFGSLGTVVTIVERGQHLLSAMTSTSGHASPSTTVTASTCA